MLPLMLVKIAVVQFEIQQYQPNLNLKRAEQFIKKASSNGAQVIVFPEDFITGPLIGKLKFADNDRRYYKIFQRFANKYKIDIVTGSFIEKSNGVLYNSSYYIDSLGIIKGSYRKVNLWLPERRYITPGNEICLVNTKYGKVGLIICWDLMFPEIFRKMVIKGIKIIYCPSYWCLGDAGVGIKYDKNSEIKSVNSLCITRAFENEIILVYANAAGRFKVGKIEDILIGQSQITVPFKGVVKIIKNNKEKMFVEQIETNILNDAESAYQIRRDLSYRII